ncbi:hypothetical protein [Paenibacillus glycanilyticus]|uniref:Uncharacterized protein n=1 Tax=Paenibacillus glycanilyticus TaxID=126569 RepID=A0ABQ6GF32_9BACL|nr:hypothetical protein [Paenibacillus glycanilyticus]GLX67923.1 hypothetical protein MU1_22680 [Paenibacillus glycanilyticus]
MKANKKSVTTIISVIVLCFIIIWIKSTSGNETLLAKASQINLYEFGNKIEITKHSDSETYNRIVELIDIEFPDIYGFDPPISDDEFKNLKSFSVEFIFKKTETILSNTIEGRKKFKIISIDFPLDDQWEYQAYVTTEDGLHYFMGARDSLKVLVSNIVPNTN